MWLKYILIFLSFLVAIIIQISFLAQFGSAATALNLVFLIFFIIAFFETPNRYYEGIFSALIAGFFIDVFSPWFFGAALISLLATYFLVKIVIYFLKERQERYFLWYFIPMFLVTWLFYNILYILLSDARNITSLFAYPLWISLAYNVILSLFGFYIYKKYYDFLQKHRQLKLFK